MCIYLSKIARRADSICPARSAGQMSVCVCVCLWLIAILFFFAPAVCMALSPGEVAVVANQNFAHSVSLAQYYMKKRQIPEGNLILLHTVDREVCSREQYDKEIALPVRGLLQDKLRSHPIRCLVTMYGVPLRIKTTPLSESDTKELNRLVEEKSALTHKLETKNNAGDSENKQIKQQEKQLEKAIRKSRLIHDNGASVDSELFLVLVKDHGIGWWTPNPYFVGFSRQKLKVKKEDVLMVSRLDGPTPEIVKRIIDDSIATEEKGLTGVAYIDARWPNPGDKKVSGYAFYDRSLHRAAEVIRNSGRMPVVLESTDKLFSADQCKNAALYCGWYHLAHYINAFEWRPGAIGYHIASSECITLHDPNSDVWCIRMLEKGVAATIGPVEEPYVESFPVPEIFFNYLLDGHLTLAECYTLSIPYLSWKQVLVGDPLYRPFKASQSIKKKN
jgi:uncharacterized protein (TIGR03790 family)